MRARVAAFYTGLLQVLMVLVLVGAVRMGIWPVALFDGVVFGISQVVLFRFGRIQGRGEIIDAGGWGRGR